MASVGDLGFDPLALRPTTEKEFIDLRNKELNNGRLAMIGVVGIVVQELIDKRAIIDHLEQFGFSPGTRFT